MLSVVDMLPGFYDEMSKTSAIIQPALDVGRRLIRSPTVQKGFAGAGRGAGYGGALGGVAGGLAGGIQGYYDAKDKGDSPISGAVRGALATGAKGLLAGAAAGGALSAISPASAEGLKQFAQRQRHSLTGWTPQGGSVSSIGAGSAQARKHLGEISRKNTASPAEIDKARKWVAAATEAEQMGMTSLPGYMKSLAKQPLKTMSTGAREQWHSGGPVTRALVFGMPAAQIASTAMSQDTPDGPSKSERMGRHLGDLAFATAPIPLVGQMAAMPLLSAAGGRVGRVLSRRPPPSTLAPPGLEPAGGAVAPAEVLASDRALGTVGSQL